MAYSGHIGSVTAAFVVGRPHGPYGSRIGRMAAAFAFCRPNVAVWQLDGHDGHGSCSSFGAQEGITAAT